MDGSTLSLSNKRTGEIIELSTFSDSYGGATFTGTNMLSYDKPETTDGKPIYLQWRFDQLQGIPKIANGDAWTLKVSSGLAIKIDGNDHYYNSPFSIDLTAIWTNPFADVRENDWFYSDVEFANAKNLFKGVTETSFEPSASMTRAMMVTALWRAAGSPATTTGGIFTDLKEGAWHYEAVNWAAGNDIVLGVGDGLFSPDEKITREQLAAILHRYEQFSGKVPADVLADREFADWGSISDYAKNPVNVLVAQGIINGKPEGLFDPKGVATRAETAATLRRYMEKVSAA